MPSKHNFLTFYYLGPYSLFELLAVYFLPVTIYSFSFIDTGLLLFFRIVIIGDLSLLGFEDFSVKS